MQKRCRLCYHGAEIEVTFMKLSIIIPVYNTREYLAVCLDSVLDNACNDYEIVIVNDGSTDDSGINVDAIEAAYTDGVLTVTLPKKAAEVPASRRLEIK